MLQTVQIIHTYVCIYTHIKNIFYLVILIKKKKKIAKPIK